MTTGKVSLEDPLSPSEDIPQKKLKRGCRPFFSPPPNLQAPQMSHCAFNNDGHPELNDPELNCPRTCVHGIHCTYTGAARTGCNFVHPGEEGTGRRLFPARMDEKTGQEQPACVRLVGSPGFYERRRLKMSWPQWCALPKNAHLRSEPRRGQEESVHSAPAAAQQKPPVVVQKKAAVAQMPPPPPAAPLAHAQQQQQPQWAQVQAKPPVGLLIMQARIQLENSSVLADHYEGIVAKGTEPTSFLGRCAQQQAPMHRTMATKAKSQLRNLFGNELFTRAESFLEEVKGDMIEGNLWSNEITAGRIVGMFLEGFDNDDLTQLLYDEEFFTEKMSEGCVVLKQAGDAKAAAAAEAKDMPAA
jgi:hypothetical protein